MPNTSVRDAASKGLQIFKGQEWWMKILWIIGIIALVTLLGLYVLPSIALAFENIAIAALWGAVLFTAFLIGINQKFQTFFMYAIDRFCLGLRDILWKTDPVGTAKIALDKLWKQVEVVQKAWSNIRGDRRQLETEQAGIIKERKEALNLAKLAQERGKQPQFEQFTTKAQSRATAIAQIQQMLDQDKAMEGYLQQLTEYLTSEHAKLADDLDMQLRMYKIAGNNASAVKAARAAMGGEDRQMLDNSMKELSDRTFKLVGEVEVFMDTTRPMLEARDFENQAKSLEAAQNFQEWLAQDSDAMPKADKQRLLLAAGATQFLPAVSTSPSAVDEYQLIK